MYTGGISGGQPNASEIRANMSLKLSEIFTKNDQDGDGGLSLKEFLAASEARRIKSPEGLSAKDMFAQMDLDRDNQVTKNEMMASQASLGKLSSGTMSSLLAAQEAI
ncbi:MAG: EF-hand domain-containing protein [Alphaproteobacteria bacterium]|nr:EF-hand domain-containing protein [Alphaproteobacteria bacterium]